MSDSIEYALAMIQTRYHGPTNTRGSRIKAWCQAGSISIPLPHELSDFAAHHAAALALIEKLGLDWQVKDGGWLPGHDAAFVMVRKEQVR